MNVTAEHAGGAVVLELDEGCRSVAALRRIISAALPDVKEDGFDVTVQGRAVEDVDVCGLEEGATIQVVESRRVVALAALRAAGRCDVSEFGLRYGMFNAVKTRDVALCEQYLEAGLSPDLGYTWGRRGYSMTPLCKAARSRLPEFCALFLQHGANVNQCDRSGETALHLCLDDTRSAHAVREVLLSHGADMRAKSNNGESPLSRARVFKRLRPPSPFNALQQFVKYGAPKLKNSDGKEYSRYIQKLAKVQFKERKQQITWKGMRIVNAFVTDVLERLGGEAGRVTSFSGAKTLSVRSVVAAVKLQLPEELATHALAAGTAAVGRYAKACGGR